VKKTSGLSAESLALADSIAKRRLGIDDVFEPDESQKTSGNAAINQNGLWERLLKQESGTRQFDSKGNVVTSQVGALGISQVMPATAMDPGFGVPNVFDAAEDLGVQTSGRTKEEAKRLLGIESVNRQFGRSYFDMLANRYDGDMTKQLIAYNAGAGVADKYNGDPKTLPDETQGYIKKILAGVEESSEIKTSPKISNDAKFSDETMDLAVEIAERRRDQSQRNVRALATEFGEGITFGFLGELVANARAAKEGIEYDQAKAEYEVAREMWKKQNPEMAGAALPLEILGAIPTGGLLVKGLTKLGTTVAKAGAAEGALYGAGTGETFEERAALAAVGGLAGLTIGKVIDVATTSKAQGGLKTQADDVSEEIYDVDTQAAQRAIDEAEDATMYTEVDNPAYAVKPLSEAQTAGELWTGLKGSLRQFYNDKLTGVSDRLGREVSEDVRGRYQAADETALRIVNKDLDGLSEELVPVIKAINESTRAKGVLLDFAAGKLGKKFDDSLARLERELADDLNAEHMSTLKRYLGYSAKKNSELNKKVFGASFGDITYLHTRNRGYRDRLKQEGMTDSEIEKMFEDPAFEQRTRGSYLDESDSKRPDPTEYENPIVSDMRRIFKMQRLAEIQRKFGVRIDDYKAGPRRERAVEQSSSVIERTGEMATDPFLLTSNLRKASTDALTPDEFMDALKFTLKKKGISEDGSEFAVREITEALMGQAKAPHPLIQAANSLAYALTLAGPLSAVLNLADIPLVGAKYGGSAVREGAKAAVPSRFKTVPNADLKKMGLDNQTFGEFVNIINDQASDASNWMVTTAEKMRNTANFLMKGSGFAAMDRVGKQGVMRGVLKSASDDAQAGTLADNWSFYFNKGELDILSSQLRKHGEDWTKYTGKGSELIEELMFAGLGQQQLISAAGRPSAWARHPNLRPLWALRGFVVKQQALALREVMGNIKAGKPEKAAEFLGRYAVYGAGGYAAINEGRQFIFGDGEASFGGLARGYGDAWASLLTANTLGLNDYQFGKIKQNGLMLTFAQGLLPITVTRPFDIAGTTIGVADREYPVARLASEVPLIRDIGRTGRNIGERFEIDPLQDFGGMMTQKRLPQED
jgi:hypothetical protein